MGTLKGVQADTIRVLVWVLGFMSFGYATAEFEVTGERLGVYRPEEHIDNPKDYADNADATQFDKRLRGPVSPAELAIDHNTGMKNYIANESGGWATSLAYIKYSFARSIHFGRLYTHGAQKGREEDLCEALRCLGQGLHCVEDFGAHTNYTELVLRELGYHNVFPHVGAQTMINLHGKQVFPLVTGTFGGVDFLHSVLGEATDHVTQTEVNQSEIDQMNAALGQASQAQNAGGKRGMGDPASKCSAFTDLLKQVPGTGGLVQEAIDLQAASDRQAAENERSGMGQDHGGYYGGASRADGAAAPTFQAPPGSHGGPPGPNVPGTTIDPNQVVARIYPFLAFRDKVVRQISAIVSKIPGLEKLIETISERVTLFIMALLAPFIKPVIAAASNALKTGSGTVVDASAKQQYLVWSDPTSTDPTHSMLSKDHFSNILNSPSGQVASEILQYVAPRVIYGWEHIDVPEQEILHDVGRVFHHPALRDQNLEVHRKMFGVVEKWARSRPHGAPDLNQVLSSESVKAGRNHTVKDFQQSVKPLESQLHGLGGSSSHSATAGGPLANFLSGSGFSSLTGGGGAAGRRDLNAEVQSDPEGGYAGYDYRQQQQQQVGVSQYQQGYEQDQSQYGGGYDQPQQQQGYGGYDQQQGYGQQGGYGGGYDQQQQQQGYGQQGGYGGYGQGGSGYGGY